MNLMVNQFSKERVMSLINRRLLTRILLPVIALLLLGGLASPAAAQRSGSRKKKPVYYTINAGQIMRVRLNQEVGSETARVGDTFASTLVDPIYSSGGVLLIPQGSTITGQITNVQRAGKNGQPATMSARFISLRLPNGSRRQFSGSLANLSSSSGQSDNESTVTAKKTSNRKLKFIGGGTAGGALIGAIAGGGKGAAIGAGVGAGTGVVASRLKKGHEIKVKAGTEYGIILNQRIALPRYAAVS
jgi:hypothetical protein